MRAWVAGMVLGASLLGSGCRQPMRQVFAERLPDSKSAVTQAVGNTAAGCGPKLEGRHPHWDLNRISERELTGLPGMTPALAHRLMTGRPYREKRALLSRHLLTPAQYDRWKDYLVVHRPR